MILFVAFGVFALYVLAGCWLLVTSIPSWLALASDPNPVLMFLFHDVARYVCWWILKNMFIPFLIAIVLIKFFTPKIDETSERKEKKARDFLVELGEPSELDKKLEEEKDSTEDKEK